MAVHAKYTDKEEGVESVHEKARLARYHDEVGSEAGQEHLPLYTDAEPDMHCARATTKRSRSCSRKSKIFFAAIILFFALVTLVPRLRHRLHCHRHRHRHGHGYATLHTTTQIAPGSLAKHSLFEPITGTYPLEDSLTLTTITGDINVTVVPQAGVGPAVLTLHSITGRIIVDIGSTESLSTLNRPFETRIESISGSVKARYVMGGGGTTRIMSQAGPLDLELLAVNVGAVNSVTTLETLAHIAGQTVTVRALDGDGRVVRVQARHTVQGAGGIDAAYPREWEGRVEATLMGAGKVDVKGEGLEVDEIDGDWHVKAHRGESDALVELVGQGLGTLKFRC